MSKVIFRIILLSLVALVSACGSSDSNANVNTNQEGGIGNVTVDANNLPEGLSTSPIAPSANTTPGIPDPKAANSVTKGATPTPGIPDPASLRKPFKPGATPTPGIPDPETLRKQMQRQVNVNAPPPTAGDSMMMKKKATPKPE
ncbi:MAG: hypothetical protein ABI857_09205 [Acidobacteriota bacterium]